MLGDTCIDCLVLGANGASMQDQQKVAKSLAAHPENGGAANPTFNRDAIEEERGSCHEDADPMAKVSPIAHL